MKVHTYLSGNPVHDRVLTAFHNGIPVDTNLTAELRDVHKYAPADVAVVFGIGKKKVPISWPRGEIIKRQMDAKGPVVVLESGYIRRGDGPEAYYAAGLGGLNGRADFKNRNMPGDRWAKLGVQLDSWEIGGQHVLVCGQVPWDASVQHHDHIGWIRQTVARLNSLTSREIIFRPHPLAAGVNYGPLHGSINSGNANILDDFMDAHAVVTFNSNSGVDALIAGIPVFAGDSGSMCLSISNTDLADIETPVQLDRTQWAYDLAYAQWTPKEMEQGWTWKHLFGSGTLLLTV